MFSQLLVCLCFLYVEPYVIEKGHFNPPVRQFMDNNCDGVLRGFCVCIWDFSARAKFIMLTITDFWRDFWVACSG